MWVPQQAWRPAGKIFAKVKSNFKSNSLVPEKKSLGQKQSNQDSKHFVKDLMKELKKLIYYVKLMMTEDS